MKADTEKALLEFVRVAAGFQVDKPASPEAEITARAYLASLEPKPQDFTCGDCGGRTWRAPASAPPLADWPQRACRECGWMEPKPEPKRGVEETLELVAGELEEVTRAIVTVNRSPSFSESFTEKGVHNQAKRLREALRLYREERERVERVKGGMRNVIERGFVL